MGLDIGLENTGRIEVIAAIENDAAACETIRMNLRRRQGARQSEFLPIHADIRTVNAGELREKLGLKKGELDIIAGGPPCQSFSTSGKRQGVQDSRGTLLWDYLRFVEEFAPKYFIIENVRGLTSAALIHSTIKSRASKEGELLPEERPGTVLEQFVRDLGARTGGAYRLDCFEVNAVNYGAPQIRERLICIGNRMGQLVEFPEPTFGPSGQNFLPIYRTLGDAIRRLDDPFPVLLDFSPRKKQYLSLIPPGGNWRCLPEPLQIESMGKAFLAKGGRSGWWRRLSYDLPCPTLVTMPNHASTSLCHPEEVRVLSIREYAAIQEFPKDWEFVGTTSEQYRQVGNAVPVRLGEVAGRTVLKYLDALHSDFRLVYLQSHVRTRKWFSNGKFQIWKDGGTQTGENPLYGLPVTTRKEKYSTNEPGKQLTLKAS